MWISEVKRTWPGTMQHGALDAVSEEKLRGTVEALAYPRDYEVQRGANEKARDWLREELRCHGYKVSLHGRYDNVIASPRDLAATSPAVLLGAHYDTVPTTPGADDNNSAIAVCLE